MNVTDDGMTLTDVNNKNIHRLIAPFVFQFIMLVIGVPGNLTVLLIYGRKYSKSVYRSIVWNLAVVDLIFCAFGIPFNIARAFRYYVFEERWICKIITALLIFGMIYSSHLLVLLSLHRFRQICMPLKSQITQSNVQYFLIACAVIGLLLSWPQVVVIDLDEVKLGNNLTGKVCPITAQNPSVASIVYSILLLCMFFVYTGGLFFIYSLIGRKMYSQRRKRLRNYTSGQQRDVSDKVTKIAFTISVVFAISYVSLFFLKVAKEWFNENDLSEATFSLLKIAERLYIVNHVANPFIYAIFDNKFRQNFRLIASFKWRFNREQYSGQSSSTATTDNS